MKYPPIDHSYEFSNLTAGYGDSQLAEFFGTDKTTIKRWKTGSSKIPHAVITLARAKFGGDLSALYGPLWSEISTTDNGLRLPGVKYPFTVEELRMTFWKLQELQILRHTVESLKKELARAHKEADEHEKQAAFYRKQLILESKMGLSLSRITS